jgi:multimeric flavodoxin WrbA
MNVLPVVGSPKPPGTSTSETLLLGLARELAARGVEVAPAVHAKHTQKPGRSLDAFVEAAEQADVVVLASPIYFDSLPYVVTATLELWADARRARWPDRPGPKLAAFFNCGFPEKRHCDLALEMAASFARHAGLEWIGGAGLPAGAVVQGDAMEAAGGRARGAVEAVAQAADAIARAEPLPPSVQRALSQPVLPKWLYLAMATAGWHWRAWQAGTWGQLGDRPATEPQTPPARQGPAPGGAG